ncbi:aminotransferase class V-fold PLP-dependent enzyme [Pseudomonas corrugata]
MAKFDLATIRNQFPAAENMLYLDAAHQTPLSYPVKARLDAFYTTALNYAGPKYGWLNRVEEVRAQLANFIGAKPDQIAFTKNTSEGLNICANGVHWEPGDNILLLEGEHPNNAYAWLAKRSAGLEVRMVPHDKKWADAETFAHFIDGRTRAIGISHVMFHSGQRNDLESIITLANRNGVKVVADSMQSIGVLPIDVKQLHVSAFASGSHKGLLTPQGLGFMYTAEPLEALQPTYVANAGVANARADLVAGLEPIQLWPNAHRFEIGNFNLPAIHALGGALEMIQEIGVANIETHVLNLGDQLIELCNELGVEIVGPTDRAHRSHIYVLDLKHPDWAAFFSDENVRLSPVRDGIRVSFGIYNTAEDVERFGQILRKGLKSVPKQIA